jgi:hypothetical protein
MIKRYLVLGIAFMLLGVVQPSTDSGSQRVAVMLVGCDDCSSNSIKMSLWDETEHDEIPVPSKQSGQDLTLQLAPGYYRLFIHTPQCGGDSFVGVLPQRDRIAYPFSDRYRFRSYIIARQIIIGGQGREGSAH